MLHHKCGSRSMNRLRESKVGPEFLGGVEINDPSVALILIFLFLISQHHFKQLSNSFMNSSPIIAKCLTLSP
jgi:hypothetical protein